MEKDGRVKDIRAGHMSFVNLALLVGTFGLAIFILLSGQTPANLNWAIYLLFFALLLFGVLFVMPIGGSDMPVVISLLNSFTGIAAAMAGFIYNRSLLNVIIGAFGGGGATAAINDQRSPIAGCQ
ncbi:NAD(P)(+) transhydrogenase (Re/Si-specific) subunit beta [uncultured Sunxiuqinia sp.]|uniref:NAD(P)(+) transhydrogenase (Re/Si-specific) subunit beta n=1 Tax=uncultured Sunxiuqinia sp. TaxID=1573825 RepID=UPI003747A893